MRSPTHALAYLLLAGLSALFRSPSRNDMVVPASQRADFAHKFLVSVIHGKKKFQNRCHLWNWKLEEAPFEKRPCVIRAHQETAIDRYRF